MHQIRLVKKTIMYAFMLIASVSNSNMTRHTTGLNGLFSRISNIPSTVTKKSQALFSNKKTPYYALLIATGSAITGCAIFAYYQRTQNTNTSTTLDPKKSLENAPSIEELKQRIIEGYPINEKKLSEKPLGSTKINKIAIRKAPQDPMTYLDDAYKILQLIQEFEIDEENFYDIHNDYFRNYYATSNSLQDLDNKMNQYINIYKDSCASTEMNDELSEIIDLQKILNARPELLLLQTEKKQNILHLLCENEKIKKSTFRHTKVWLKLILGNPLLAVQKLKILQQEDVNGHTPIDHALIKGNSNIMRILMNLKYGTFETSWLISYLRNVSACFFNKISEPEHTKTVLETMYKIAPFNMFIPTLATINKNTGCSLIENAIINNNTEFFTYLTTLVAQKEKSSWPTNLATLLPTGIQEPIKTPLALGSRNLFFTIAEKNCSPEMIKTLISFFGKEYAIKLIQSQGEIKHLGYSPLTLAFLNNNGEKFCAGLKAEGFTYQDIKKTLKATHQWLAQYKNHFIKDYPYLKELIEKINTKFKRQQFWNNIITECT